tara:strand:+ start:1240 stop:2052 length:813 start_codon:yes stop_codon:yes gene_type:complete
MQWTKEQRATFDQEGVLFVERLFSPQEVACLNAELPFVLSRSGPENLMEQSSHSIRSAIAPHHCSELFYKLSRHPRIIEPAAQWLGGSVYLHQFKVNTKNAHDGEIWHWHQDYRTWFEDDGMPEPNVINAALFLDEVNEFNGPTMFVPGTHKLGMISSDKTFDRIPEYGRLAEDAVGSPYTNETIDRLIRKYGIIAPKGPAGSVVFFHGCTLHGSAPNMSPWNRTIVFWSPNRTDNAITAPTRPDFLALQDFNPIEPLADDCLVKTSDVS